jgi:hypothetical protein
MQCCVRQCQGVNQIVASGSQGAALRYRNIILFLSPSGFQLQRSCIMVAADPVYLISSVSSGTSLQSNVAPMGLFFRFLLYHIVNPTGLNR